MADQRKKDRVVWLKAIVGKRREHPSDGASVARRLSIPGYDESNPEQSRAEEALDELTDRTVWVAVLAEPTDVITPEQAERQARENVRRLHDLAADALVRMTCDLNGVDVSDWYDAEHTAATDRLTFLLREIRQAAEDAAAGVFLGRIYSMWDREAPGRTEESGE